MKILHLIHAYSPAIGGSEFLVQQVSEYLSNSKKHDVTVFTTFAYNSALFTKPNSPSISQKQENETINNTKIRRFRVINRWGKILYLIQYAFYKLHLPGNGFLRMLFYGPISPQMKQAVMDSDADIIASAPFPLNHMGYGFKNKNKAPVILIGCAHTADKHAMSNRRIKKMIRRASGYIALTAHEKDFLVNNWNIDENKIAVIGVGIDTLPEPSEKSSTNTPNRIRAKNNIPQDAPLIAFMGQHGLHKGIKTLIHSMRQLWEKHPETHLLIAGGTTPFTASFKQLAQKIENNSCQRIHFNDNVDEKEKQEILDACDIFASPSGFESFGITILEAWRAGKPVVACNIPATRQLIENDKTGKLVEYENSDQLAEALEHLIENPDLRKTMGKNGYQHFKNHYTKEIIGEKYNAFYQKVLRP